MRHEVQPESGAVQVALGRDTFPRPGHLGRSPGGSDVEAPVQEISQGQSDVKENGHVLTEEGELAQKSPEEGGNGAQTRQQWPEGECEGKVVRDGLEAKKEAW